MLAPGARLGRYEVISPLGAGGMGEVYRARDTELDREVAIKVLPAGALADETARKRFRKEAHALSRLAHPHLATLHDFGSADGIDFLVMELVPGSSLEAALAKGALSEKEVVRLGAQMVRGLVAAHEHGVIHRDIKPSNIRLTPDGLVKVLDFGLARVEAAADEGTTESASGIVAGTPPYMSPEQLLGKVDERSDVYGVGVVLYQMATGKRPFGEASGPRLVAAILNEVPPPPREVNPSLSSGLEAVILKAADKDPSLRYQTAKELLVDLERLAAGQGVSASRPSRPPRASKSATWLVVLVLTVLLAVAAATAWRSSSRDPRITGVRALVRVPIDVNGLETDGVNVYYAESVRPTDRLMAMPLAGGAPQEIPLPWRDEAGLQVIGLRSSPPALLLCRGGELWRIPLPGGVPTRLGGIAHVPEHLGGAAWSRKGDGLTWIERSEASDSLYVGDAEGGHRRRLVEVERQAGNPEAMFLIGWLPGDQRVRFSRGDRPDRFFDAPIEGGPARDAFVVPSTDFWGRPEWSPSGRHFIYATTKALQAFPETDAKPGAQSRSLAAPSHLFWTRFTPDGRRLVGFVNRPATEVVRLDPQTKTITPLLGTLRAGVVEFSPDGSRVAWVSHEEGWGRLWCSRPDGTERIQLSELEVYSYSSIRWSPDGKWVAFAPWDEPGLGTRKRVYLAAPGRGQVELLAPSDASVSQGDPCWSPDGTWLAYGANEMLLPSVGELYLRRVELTTRVVTKLRGSEGLWGPRCAVDGRILAFDRLAQQSYGMHYGPTGQASPRAYFKLRDPARGDWTPFFVDLPAGSALCFPTWSHDGRFVYAYLYVAGPRKIVRFDLTSRRLQTVFGVEGLGDSSVWMGLDPMGAPLVHRDVSQREIVIMDWEER